MSDKLFTMSEVPETRYATNGDVHLAYQVRGNQPPDLLIFPFGVVSIDSVEEEPSLARFHNRLASFCRLIRFDLRGMGLSDPVSPTNPPTLEQWMGDAVAVLDALGSARSSVFASQESSLEAILLAATYPDRVASLIIMNGTARTVRAEDYPVGISRRAVENFLDVNMETDAVDRGLDFLALEAPSMARDEGFREWWVRAGNRGASPSMARAIHAVRLFADVRSLLPLLRVPTLVLHRRDNLVYEVGHGRYLAEHIPGARYVELEGADDLYWIGNSATVLEEIEEFLTGVRRGTTPDRVLATILFTDIVGSTEQLAALGEQRWRDLLDRHDVAVRRQIQRFGGREVKTTGDGVLATFDGPARAVRCACAVRDVAAQIGIAIRAGVHTGEVEVRGNDIAGMAVHIAARVEALARRREILVSRTVVDLTVGSGIDFTERGEHDLKGVPGRWRLFAVEE